MLQLVMMMKARFPLSLGNVDDLLAEKGSGICHETSRLYTNKFDPLSRPMSGASGPAG